MERYQVSLTPPPSRKRRPATTAISQLVEKKVEALRVRFMDSALA